MISTHTKNLQSQLYDKDIPFLKAHLGVNFNAAILRGRSNYLCVRKLMYTMQEAAARIGERGARRDNAVLCRWATQTESGDVNEMTSFSPEQNPGLWDRLHTVGEDCLKRACPFFKRCFVYKARGQARTADVVVINHALVFSALNQEAGDIARVQRDRFRRSAQTRKFVATDHLACEIAPRRVQKILGRLFRTGSSGGAGKGLLPSLLAQLEQARGEFTPPLFDQIRQHVVDVMQALQPAGAGSDLFFDIVRSWTERPNPATTTAPLPRRANRTRAQRPRRVFSPERRAFPGQAQRQIRRRPQALLRAQFEARRNRGLARRQRVGYLRAGRSTAIRWSGSRTTFPKSASGASAARAN